MKISGNENFKSKHQLQLKIDYPVARINETANELYGWTKEERKITEGINFKIIIGTFQKQFAVVGLNAHTKKNIGRVGAGGKKLHGITAQW
ncbi:MAG: hypothetical protein ABIO46_13590 [Chitinophagales bacterium]